jgi:hypothetical protein
MDIPTVGLDDLFRDRHVPTVIKIDVEGTEVEVLAGARNLFSSAQPVVSFATHSPELRVTWHAALREFGFSLAMLGNEPDEVTAAPASYTRRAP